MHHGYIKVAAITPQVQVADPFFNAEKIYEAASQAVTQGTKLLVFPELSITGYTCGDLFLQEKLLQGAKDALRWLLKKTSSMDALLFVGMPWIHCGKIFNTMVALSQGEILGVVPKKYLPNYSEFYEKRYFASTSYSWEETTWIDDHDQRISLPFGTNLLFFCREMENFIVAAEICEDLWAPLPPSTYHALAGATVLVNGSASDEVTGKNIYRRDLVVGQSGRLLGAYIYANAGEGESTTDVVYGGHNIIAENGALLEESERFHREITYAVLDVDKLVGERRKNASFSVQGYGEYRKIFFSLQKDITQFMKKPHTTPFVPADQEHRQLRCEEILSIQAMGLKKRLEHTHCKHAVIGISGGLDSTLALLVTVMAFDLLGLPRKGIHAVTMPCFGTTDRTYQNACTMARKWGTDLLEIPIQKAVRQHFADIGHEENIHNVTYENSQARERTQVLMDLANRFGGMVIGTGDMSELALGWATYNGDHMSMYGVNAGIPKTLVRYLVKYYAETCAGQELSLALLDVLDTPVSPELLPPEEGKISQKTEDLVGPYELHDFFLYYAIRFGFSPAKIYRLAKEAFSSTYEKEVILAWLKNFYRRFFAQQFKRSCLPDGPKVGTVALSPRGDWRMPSDACVSLWLKEVEKLSSEE